ncbi:MAG TPA: exodeoxyribonuclease VII large subunit [Acidimicrobiia bacterium]|nr:exodeoxyribonuclease VII large subunit [Acidimicrobiia bacterium]
MTDQTLTVSEVMRRLQQVVVAEFPTPLWVRGEVTGMRRTSGGAVFFRLADPDDVDTALDVVVRGRVMMEVDRVLGDAGLGRLGDGVEARMKGTINLDRRGSRVRLSLHHVDPAFTAGRMALNRVEVIRRMTADGSLSANASLPLPLVPLELGLVTSRGSAAHADFTDQLIRSGFRFHVKTVHTSVQGDGAADSIAAALERVRSEPVDLIVVIRGGGSKLDLSVFDREVVARAVAGSPIPVITGIGHDIDRTVTDEAAAVVTKTPSAAGEWLVARVKDYADRISVARHSIRSEAGAALRRHRQLLRTAAADVAGSATALRRQKDALDRLRDEMAHASRNIIERRRSSLEGLAEWFKAVDVEPTLRRGFAIVTTEDGTVVRSTNQVDPGQRLDVRVADGTVRVIVEEQ